MHGKENPVEYRQGVFFYRLVDTVEQINIDGDKVDGRQLHAFLQVETPYHIWFPRMIEYGFSEGRDFMNKNVHESREPINHDLTMDVEGQKERLQIDAHSCWDCA